MPNRILFQILQHQVMLEVEYFELHSRVLICLHVTCDM